MIRANPRSRRRQPVDDGRPFVVVVPVRILPASTIATSRQTIAEDTAKMVVPVFVSSRLDY